MSGATTVIENPIQIAIKVINHYGDEVMRVYDIAGA